MREAIGEANLTVLTIILIGTILPIFYLIIPRLLDSMADKACCIQNNGEIVERAGKNKCLISYNMSGSGAYYDESGFRKYCK